MSFNRRIERIEKEANHYITSKHTKKRAFAVMRKIQAIGLGEPTGDDLIELFIELITINGSDSIKHKLNITDEA